ncbi:transcriptional regulator with XRE-family HTH domain [Caldicoprobacter guelmensis]|jgi:transcriptional regulator with XRE-family HTH domain|uniref:helix-turn-helix domain-containing protein n=1 Tax=Caldicoprobacter guelmensis TaxID=1170224 RepID=UPI00195A9AB0|nr:helix-turn-helix transcriptional regulator [Caldicoprobacter guelmensis]MBM7582971.1 transcriptional regulator with XRE-family HTH domain [Caldicoprobacter guelmensis]
MKIGDRIKQLREETNMGRAELAQKIGITYYALSKYETNERQPDYETLKKIARLFNVSTDYLLGYSDIRNPYEKTYDKLGINELSPESKKELEKFVELLKLKDKMDKTKDEMSSALDSNAQ